MREYNEPLKSISMIFKINFSTYIWLLPFICFLSGFYGMYRSLSYHEYTMPLLVGKNLFESTQIISDYNLNMRIHEYKVDKELPQGTILWQSPAAGQKIKSSQTIFCTLSTVPSTLDTPDFCGKTTQEIKALLEEHHLTAQIFFIKKQSAPICFAQQPTAGQKLPQGAITLYVADPHGLKIIMPSFINQPIDPVQEFLKNYAHEIIIIREKNIPEDHYCPRCIVKAQKPVAGSILLSSQLATIQLQVGH